MDTKYNPNDAGRPFNYQPHNTFTHQISEEDRQRAADKLDSLRNQTVDTLRPLSAEDDD